MGPKVAAAWWMPKGVVNCASPLTSLARSARGASLAVTIARFENQHVLADPRVYEHRAGKHRTAVPTAAAVAVEFEVAFLEPQRANQFSYHLAFRLPVVEGNHSIDVLHLQPRIRDRLEACLGGEA